MTRIILYCIVVPPDTLRTCPVIYPDTSDARKAAALAISMTVAPLPSGVSGRKRLAEVSFISCGPFIKLVSVDHPGETQFTLILEGASCLARPLIKSMTPPLAMLYICTPGKAILAVSEAMFTILPYLRATMWGNTACVTSIGPFRLRL